MDFKEVNVSLDYVPIQWQAELHAEVRRKTCLLIHRRAGKTVFCVAESINACLTSPYKNPKCFYVGVTRDQVKQSAWQYYKDMLAPMIKASEEYGFDLVTFNEADLSIRFLHNNGVIYLKSYENIESLRGTYGDHFVLDEYQKADYDSYDTVVSPMMADHLGSVIFSGTVLGRNQLYQTYEKAKRNKQAFIANGGDDEWAYNTKVTWDETGALSEGEKKRIREENSDEAIRQEFYCDPNAEIKEAYYSNSLTKIMREGRIVNINVDKSKPTIVGWDIGYDGTCGFFLQEIDNKFHLVDCLFYKNKDLNFGLSQLIHMGYNYDYHILPHDAKSRNKTNHLETIEKSFKSEGYSTRVNTKATQLINSINAGRVFLDNVFFTEKCANKRIECQGSEIDVFSALALYRSKEDSSAERHDDYSHIGAAIRNLADGIKTSDRQYLNVSKPDKFFVRKQLRINQYWTPFK